MVDATRVFEPGFQVTNAAGTPQSGAVLRFYDNTVGGATRTVYSNTALSTSLGVTVTTNASGRPAASGGVGAETLIYTGTTPYAVTAETSAGVAIWSFDSILGALDTSTFLTGSAIAEYPIISKTANYSIVVGDSGKIINANPTGGAFTLTLPSAVTMGDGWPITIRHTGTANTVAIATVSAQTINGATSRTLNTQQESMTLVSDGANWHIKDWTRMYLPAEPGYIITESHVASAVTFSIKNLLGDDPSAASPVFLWFRSPTVSSGLYSAITVAAALTLTLSSGSTMGFTSAIAGKLWLVVFDDVGTARMGAINCLKSTGIYPLGQMPIASSTAEGGAGAADSAHVFYTGTAVSSKAYVIAGYASYEDGVPTAGSWTATPTRVQMFGDGVPLPGTVVQTVYAPKTDTSTVAVTIGTFSDMTGLTASIPMTSAANAVEFSFGGGLATTTAATSVYILALRGSTALIRGDAASNRIRASISAFVVSSNEGPTSFGYSLFDATPGSGTVVYKLQFTGDRTENYFINRSLPDTDTTSFARGSSFTQLKEITA